MQAPMKLIEHVSTSYSISATISEIITRKHSFGFRKLQARSSNLLLHRPLFGTKQGLESIEFNFLQGSG